MLSKQYIKHYKSTFWLAYPIVMSQFGHILVGVVDTAMVGQIGSVEQAAVALSNSLYTLLLVFGLGVSYGVTPLVASADSSGNKLENAQLLNQSIIINTVLGIILFLVLFFLSPLLNHFNQKQEVVVNAIPFLNVMMLGMIPLCFFSGLKQFLEGLSDTKAAMYISVLSNILNIVLNYVMIFGHWGFPKMGLMGSCWASFIARMLMAVAMFFYVYYNKRYKYYWEHFSIKNYSKSLTKKILAIGVPSGFQWMFEVGAFAFAVIMIGWIGHKQQAAHQVALSLAAVTYMMASGLSAAASVKVGNQMGLKSSSGVRMAGFSAFFMVIFFMGLMAILFLLFRNQLPVLFNKDAEVISIASSLLVVAAVFQISDGIQVVALGALRGVKDVKIPTAITIIAYWIIGLPMSYIFAFNLNLGVKGIWYGLLLGLTTAAILLFLRFNYISKKII